VKFIVLDASVSLGWFVDDPVPAYSVRVKDSLLGGGRAVVPALWHLEMANGLVMAERRGILSTIDTEGALVRVEQFLTQVIETETDLFSVRQTLTSARSFNLSAYDAAYLETSKRYGLPLATLDRQLRAAAGRAGVELFA
jgi:predicted nucleic acid-binding protein